MIANDFVIFLRKGTNFLSEWEDKEAIRMVLFFI